jgi:hypothetical protein
MNMEHAVMLLADAGGKGIGTVYHVRVGERDANVIEFLFAFDTGSRTVGNFFLNNESYTVITADRKYIVSKQHRLGDPLSMSETRLTTPTQDCPLMLHTSNGNYRILSNGTFQCTTYGGAQHSITTWGKGQYIHLGYMDSCTSTCMAVGPLHYRMEHRELGSIPAVHANALRHQISTSANTLQSTDTAHTKAYKMQREMQAMIEETQTQIDMITIEQNADKEQASEQWGWVAIGISIGTLVLMAGLTILGIRLWRRRGSRNRNQRAGNDEQLPVMEMRLVGLEQQGRSGSRATRHGNLVGSNGR